MALEDFHYGYIRIGDSRKRTTEFRVRVTSGEANAYYGALTQPLKDATALGLFFLSVEALTAGTMMGKGVVLETVDDAAVFPDQDSDIYNFDKLAVSYKAGLYNYQITIPSRKGSAYTLAADGVTVITTAPGWTAEINAFITRFNGIVLAEKTGVQGTVQKMYVSS